METTLYTASTLSPSVTSLPRGSLQREDSPADQSRRPKDAPHDDVEPDVAANDRDGGAGKAEDTRGSSNGDGFALGHGDGVEACVGDASARGDNGSGSGGGSGGGGAGQSGGSGGGNMHAGGGEVYRDAVGRINALVSKKKLHEGLRISQRHLLRLHFRFSRGWSKRAGGVVTCMQ